MRQILLSRRTAYSAAKTIIYATIKRLSLELHMYSRTTNEMQVFQTQRSTQWTESEH